MLRIHSTTRAIGDVSPAHRSHFAVQVPLHVEVERPLSSLRSHSSVHVPFMHFPAGQSEVSTHAPYVSPEIPLPHTLHVGRGVAPAGCDGWHVPLLNGKFVVVAVHWSMEPSSRFGSGPQSSHP